MNEKTKKIASLKQQSQHKLPPFVRIPAKWMAGLLVRGVMRCWGWHFPAYFTARDRWRSMNNRIEPDLVRFASRKMMKGETVLDIGANVGLLARHFCELVGQSGHVIAFEPAPDNLESLRYNLRRYPQSEIVELAISDKNGTATFYLNCMSGTGNSLIPHPLGTATIQARSQTLDAFLSERANVWPDWIKIDVEGGEFKVLQGMKETVSRFPNAQLFVEICPNNLGGLKQADLLATELKKMGYGLHLIRLDGTTETYGGVSAHPEHFAPHGYVNILCNKK